MSDGLIPQSPDDWPEDQWGQEEPPRDQRSKDTATVVALLGLLLAGAGLMALFSLVLHQLMIVAIFVLVIGFVGYIGLHYLVWGRLLSQRRPQDQPPEEEGPDPDDWRPDPGD